MTDSKTPGQDAYPLTIVGTDADGSEVYRTQLDWSGVARKLDEVPSRDLGDRGPKWAKVQIFDATGKEVESRTNDDAGSADEAREARGPSYANDKAPISPTDVRNDKPEESALAESAKPEGESSVKGQAAEGKDPAKAKAATKS